MQSSTGQYSTQAGEPAQPVQHSVITASSFGFFLRAVVIPLERGSYFSSSGTIPAVFGTSRSAAMRLGYPRRTVILSHFCFYRGYPSRLAPFPQQAQLAFTPLACTG